MATIGVGGGAGGLSFSKLQSALLAGSNMTITANASAKQLTFTAVGNFPNGGSIAGASDTSFSTLSNGQILVRSGTNWVNVTASGDVRVTNAGAVTVQSGTISGAKISDRGVPLTKLDSSGETSGNILEVTSTSGVDTVTKLSLVSSVLEVSGSLSTSVVSNKLRITGTSAITSLSGVVINNLQNNQILIADNDANKTLRNRTISGAVELTHDGLTSLTNDSVGTNQIESGTVTIIKLSASGGSSGQVPTISGSNVVWQTPTGGGNGGGSTTLSGLTDTNIHSISSGHILIWDGNQWDNRSVQGDVRISSIGNFQIQA